MLRNLSTGKKRCLEYFMIILGTAIMAFATKIFLDPEGFVPGGFTGVAIIVKAVSSHIIEGGIPLWVTNLMLNIPLFPAMIWLNGWKMARRTLMGSLLFTFWLAVIPYFSILNASDLFLGSVYGGVLTGIGIGLVFLGKGTTGGTDMCGAILQYFFPHLSIPTLMQLLDLMIVIVGIWVFGVHTALYSILVVYLTAKVSDRMMEGTKNSVMAYIISENYKDIADAIMEDMDRGVTGLHGCGMYTNSEKTLLMCVVSPREIVQIKEIVMSVDSRAFIIVNDSKEVMGEGFVEYSQNKGKKRLGGKNK